MLYCSFGLQVVRTAISTAAGPTGRRGRSGCFRTALRVGRAAGWRCHARYGRGRPRAWCQPCLPRSGPARRGPSCLRCDRRRGMWIAGGPAKRRGEGGDSAEQRTDNHDGDHGRRNPPSARPTQPAPPGEAHPPTAPRAWPTPTGSAAASAPLGWKPTRNPPGAQLQPMRGIRITRVRGGSSDSSDPVAPGRPARPDDGVAPGAPLCPVRFLRYPLMQSRPAESLSPFVSSTALDGASDERLRRLLRRRLGCRRRS